ncbi:MAG: PQQ-dependent sugar dehydrogenase [Streptosporangiales bacterium]|nr:PQQ-dependent sugar dehydrogenase [Streptosporangiales bacterium]
MGLLDQPHRPLRRRSLFAAALAGVAGSVVSGRGARAAVETADSPSAEGGVPTPVVTGTVVDGLQVPWGVAPLPGGGALVGERDTARLLQVDTDGAIHEVGRVPGVEPDGEGGLLGLATSPHFASDHHVFAYYSTPRDNRIARLSFRGGRLDGPSPIVTGIPHASFHNGGRIVFGPDEMLYVASGDATVGDRAQDLGSLGGKILRMTPAGNPAPGNPFRDSLIYSMGHRNVEGLAFDSRGRLWASEFGEDTWDELNLIRAGGNYGWPDVEGRGDNPDYINPAAQWRPAEASPSGIAIVNDVIYLANLRGERVWQVPIRGDHVGTPRRYLTGGYGRLRSIQPVGEGSLWVTTSNRDGRGEPRAGDDRILHIALRR